MKSEKSASIITIHRPAAMTKRGRKDIAEWMRRQADDFEKLGDQYSETRFTARYIVNAG